MVISLYVCEIPINVSKKDLDNIFAEIEGFKESRLKITNDKRKIAFVDYETEKDAKFALETLQGFRFSQEDRGMLIKISDNTIGGTTQSNRGPRDDRNKRMLNNKKRRGESSDSSEKNLRGGNYKQYNSRRDRSLSQDRNNNYHNNNSSVNPTSVNSNKFVDKNNSYNPVKPSANVNQNEIPNINQNNIQNFPQINQNPLNTPNLIDLLNIFSTINPNNSNQNTNKPYTLPENSSSNPVPNPPESANPLNNIFECLQNLQTVQLISSLAGANSNSLINQSSSQDVYSQGLSNNLQNISNYNQNLPKPEATSNKNKNNHNTSSSNANTFYNNFFKFDDYFKDDLKFKRNATNIVYVEGLPLNSTEREVAHIFRAFQGFKSVRLVFRDKGGEKSLICFADFENVTQSTICINTLQGYRFDKNDLVGLHFSYGVSKHK
jgi:hypothetical protein